MGHKSLAVNLSDLAACGARPLAFTLALSLPEVDAPWLQAFSEGLLALADAHQCELIGGDTTRGPLTISITVLGEVPADSARLPVPTSALLRSGARPGDDVYVSGHLGDAALALRALQSQIDLPEPLRAAARQRLEAPQPRVALGQALRPLASACAEPLTAFEAAQTLFPRAAMEQTQVAFAVGETLAHLRRLERQGRLLAEPGRDGLPRFRRG